MSQSARFVNYLLRKLKFNKMFLDIEDSNGEREKFSQIVTDSRAKDDEKVPPLKLFKQYEISKISTNGHMAYLIKHKSGTNRKVIIYFHGGAYVKGPLPLQWKLLSEIAKATMYDFVVLDYPKTPEYTCIDAIGFCAEVFEKTTIDYKLKDIVFLGDSAGGGLALSTFMVLRESGKKIPGKIILLSPWLDVSMENKSIAENMDRDFILTIDGLKICGLFYAGEIDTKDWRVSPMYGNLEGLPEVHIFAGGSELFAPDCRDFVRNAKLKGSMVELHYYEDMQHDWPIMPVIPEAKQAKSEIIELIK